MCVHKNTCIPDMQVSSPATIHFSFCMSCLAITTIIYFKTLSISLPKLTGLMSATKRTKFSIEQAVNLTLHFNSWDWRTDCRRSQKVISGQEDTSSSQETSVYTWETSLPSDNAKRLLKTRSPMWPTKPPVSRSLCIPHYGVFLVSPL
jgi:hypothetical protein